MIILKEIIYKVAIEAIKGSTDIAINKMEFDSRKIETNDVFVAIRGTISDGHDFIETAIWNGAIAVVCDSLPGGEFDVLRAGGVRGQSLPRHRVYINLQLLNCGMQGCAGARYGQ